ncbi:MAG: hypothetical protein DMF90_12315, partial [Acidobacteria bacterium]
FSDWNCSTGQRQLLPGDLFAIYTDGITEAFNPLEQEFGEDRLVDTLQRLRQLNPNEIVDAVLEEVARFSPREQRDDLTLIVARCKV